MSDNIQILQLV